MDRPDTMIELHREQVEAKAGAVYAGDTYTQPYNGGYGVAGTATITLSLGRVWFVEDRHERLWREAGQDPERHFALDLEIGDARVLVTSVAGVPLVPLPADTITVPNGPRQGEQRTIAFNEIPLFGRLTLHEHLEVRSTGPGLQTVSLDFGGQAAPALVADPPPDQFVSRLYGPGVTRQADGSTAFGGSDPRVIWDLDYAEAFWIMQSRIGTLLATKERVLNPTATTQQVQDAVLGSIADELAAAVRSEAANLGDGGVVDLLPSPLEVDAASREGNRALDAVVQRFNAGTGLEESLVIQLQTMDPLPVGEDIPASVLAENLGEQVGLCTSGFGLLRGVRETVQRSFCLDDTDFTDAPCELAGARNVQIGGEERTLNRFTASIAGGTGGQRGRLVVDGRITDSTWAYHLDATFTVTYEMDLDDIPREAAPGEVGIHTGQTKAELDAMLRQAAQDRCAGTLSTQDHEDLVAEAGRLLMELPRTVGIRPMLNPATPQVNPDFSLTVLGAAAVLGALVAAAALPIGVPVFTAGGFAALGALGTGGLIVGALLAYIALLIDIDWYGTGMVRGKVQDALGDRPGGSLLPTLGVPIDVHLDPRRLAVWFRPIPPSLEVGCVKRDTAEDIDDVLQLVGGVWPTDGRPWKISDADGVLMIDSGALDLSVAGTGQPIHVSTSSAGRRYLRTNPDGQNPDNLHALPQCPRTP
jgi:hypothetical protein